MKNRVNEVLAPVFIQRINWASQSSPRRNLCGSWIKLLLLISVTGLSACHKASKHSREVALAQTPTETPNPINGDAKPALSVKLPDLLRTNKESLIKAQTTGASSWEWSQISGPGSISFQNLFEANTTVRADKDGVYLIRLTVRNEQGQTAFNEMTLQWDTEAPTVLISQEVRAFQSLILDGKVGSDTAKLEWSQVSGPGNIVFETKDAKSTRVTAPVDGTYTLRLTAADDLGNQRFAEMQLIWDSVAPTVSVGQDIITNQEVLVNAMSVDAVSFAWSKISGPGAITFSSATAEDTSVKASVDGNYVLRLTITKASGATAFDDLILTWDTTPPLVSLGMDRSSRYRATVDAVTEGGLTYRWSQKAGSGIAIFSNPNSEDTSITTNLAGNYEFELLVTDQAGNSASDRLIISFEYDLRVLAKQLSGGGSGTCAVLDDDSLSCWGYNYEGELGYGDNKDRYMPPAFGLNIGSGKTAVAVSTGYAHSCAILNDSSVKCWGQNAFGELGYGDQMPHNMPPAQPINLGTGRTAKAIATGFSHSCALLDDASIKCWGSNGSGQLGYGDFKNRLIPPQTSINLGAGRTAKSISLGAYHSCATLDDNSIKCWGSNADGQLGYGDRSTRSAPAVNSLSFPVGLSVASVSAGHYHTCAILSDSSLRCWGRNSNGQLGYGDLTGRSAPAASAVEFGTSARLLSVTGGLLHSCALFDDGSLQCWGDNEEGQLGYGDNQNRLAPSQVPLSIGNGRVALSLSAGRLHSCALLDDRSLKCWGSNGYGQLGNGNTNNQTAIPTRSIEYGNKTSTLVTQR